MPRRLIARVLRIQPCGRRAACREPVQRDVVEHGVPRDDRFRVPVAVGPIHEFLVDPRGLSGRRVHEAVAKCLRPRFLDAAVARTCAEKRFQLGNGSFLFGGGGAFKRRRRKRRKVQVNRRQPIGLLLAQPCGDMCAPVAALSDPAVITEPLHQRAPRGGDPPDIPAHLSRLFRKTVAWQRRNNDVERILGASAMCFRVGQRPDDVKELNH